MSLLSLDRVSYSHIPGIPLLSGVTLTIDPGDRIGLIGPNGSGKTTLLQLLAGELSPDEGRLIRRKGLRWQMIHRSQDAASSGERMREALAEVLRDDATLLLLDEPTNHLDSQARRWLAARLMRPGVTCVLVSHDRDFLDEVTTKTVAIERGAVRVYSGGYELAMAERGSAEERHWSDFRGQQRRIAAAEEAAAKRDRLAAKVATAPEGARHSHDFYRRKAAKVSRTGRLLRERQMIEATIEKPWEEQPISTLDFSGVASSGRVLVYTRSLSAGYGEPVIEDLMLCVNRGERWAVTGPNGSGKTTLFRTLLGELPALAGNVEFGSGVHTGYYAQEHEQLEGWQSARECCLAVCADETRVRTMLGCLKVGASLVDRPLGSLSPGERSKTALARLLLGRHNLLLFDEPTNHLEMEAQEALAQALLQFPGGILFASHDRWFTRQVATHHLELGAKDSRTLPAMPPSAP